MVDKIKLTKKQFMCIMSNLNEIISINPQYAQYIYNPENIAITTYELKLVDTQLEIRYAYNTDTKILRSFFTFAGERIEITGVDVGDKAKRHIDTIYKSLKQQLLWSEKCQSFNVTPNEFGAEFIKLFYGINFYLLNLPTEVREVKESVTETYVENKKGDKRYKSRTVLKHVIYIDAKPFNKTKIKHIIKCLCWGVRGHERHYKSGKVVFIKPFRKGVERNNDKFYVPKDYVVDRKEV